MSWVGFRIRFATAFSYRWPEVAGMALPLPGPSAVRLALVGAARERAKTRSPSNEARDAHRMLTRVRDAPLFIEPPEQVTLWTATVRRLAAQRGPSAGIRRDALPREFASPSGPYTIWVDLPDEGGGEEVLEALPWLRSLGTRESLCQAARVERGAAPRRQLAGGEVPEAAESPTEGVLVELKDLAPDATLEGLESGEAYRSVVWALPGDFLPVDESARVFERRPWFRVPAPSWP